MEFSKFRRACEPLIRKVFHTYWRFARGMTLGVRGLVIDPQGRIFLVKHSYVTGWYLPGGGVEHGETAQQALVRELREEGNIELSGKPALFGFYYNPKDSPRDHVAVFVVRDFYQSAPPVPGVEIVAHGFFAPDALPDDATPATRARVAEVLYGAVVADRW